MRSCSRSRTKGARGALPTEQRVTELRSALSKRGFSSNRVAMAGTRNTADGRSDSTVSNHWSAANRGWKMTRIPSFMGVYTKEMPAKVYGGLACNHPCPLHVGLEKGTSEEFSWR